MDASSPLPSRRGSRLTAPVFFLIATAVFSQAPSPLRFEVASIKAGGDKVSPQPDRTVGRIRWTTDLCYLIGYAYRLDSSRVSGSKCDSYFVEATFDPAATDDQVRLMLQSLLADRFKMRAHLDTTEANGYALTLGRGGLKIKEAQDASSEPRDRSYIAAIGVAPGVVAITGRRVSMAQLAERLQGLTSMPVWDRTGLSGNYDFTFRYARDLTADLQTDAPSLATALQENLGLKLEKQKGPLETLIIDHVEEPSEN